MTLYNKHNLFLNKSISEFRDAKQNPPSSVPFNMHIPCRHDKHQCEVWHAWLSL